MKLRVKTKNWLSRLLFTIHYSLFTVFLLLTSCFLLPTSALAADKWGGVDESVVEKYAEEHGRTAREPFINTDQGDLLLFVFLLAGAVGGFAGGYYWRMLTEKGTLTTEHTKQT
ncbi:MAG: cobalt transporter [Nitrospirota bacterium]